ncbi:MAG: hypothetical protein HY958_07945, partial [Bacteroidia bacterium]|nr:hypothetical protein [Bacteroidia bacterium]
MNNKRTYKVLIVLFTALFAFYQTFATTYYSKSGQTDPNTLTNWTTNSDGTGGNPANFTSDGDVFIVQSGHSYTTTAAWNITGASTLQVEGTITVAVANTVTLGTAASKIGNLTINNGGIVQANDLTTIAHTSGAFTINAGGKYILNHTSANSTTTFNGTESFAATSTFEYQNLGAGGFITAITYGNLIWNSSSTARTFPAAITINGNLDINAGTLNFVATVAKTLTIGGNLTIAGGTFYVLNGPDGSADNAVLTVTNLTISSGNLYLNNDNGNWTADATLNVNGNFIMSGGLLDMIPTSLATSSNTYAYLNISGNYTWSGGTLQRTNNQAAGPYTEIDFIKASGTQEYTQTLGSTTYSSAGRGISWFETGVSNVNLTYIGTTGTARGLTSPSGNITVNCSGTCTFPSATTVAGIFYMTQGTVALSSTLSWGASAQLIYNGNAAQTTSEEWPATFAKNVTISNTVASPAGVTLSRSTTVSAGANCLTLTNGLLLLSNYDLTLSNTAATISGTPDATKMIVTNGTGKFYKAFATGASSFTFPVGDVTGTAEYSPVTLNFTANAVAGNAGVIVTDATHASMGSSTDYLSRYWSFTTTGLTTYTYDMTCYYMDADINGTEANLKVSRWDASTWTVLTSSVTPASNYISFTGLANTIAPLTANDYTGRTLPPGLWKTTAATTSWNTGSNWEGGSVPTSTVNVSIPAGCTNWPVIDVNPAECQDLSIAAGAHLTCSANNTLNVYGNWNVSGSGYFDATTGTVVFKKTGTQSITMTANADDHFYNLTTGDGVVANTVNSGSTLDINGSLSITANSTLDATASNYNIEIAGDWSNSGTFNEQQGTVTYDGSGAQSLSGETFYNLTINNSAATPNDATDVDPSAAVTVSNILSVTDGQFQPPSASDFKNITIGTNGILKPDASATITISGDWSNAGTFTPNSGTVEFDGSVAQALTGETFYNLTINNSAGTPGDAVDVDPSAAVTVSNTLTVTDGQFQPPTGSSFKDVTIAAAGILKPDASASITVSGNWSNTSGTFTHNSGSVTFSGTLNIISGGITAGKEFYNGQISSGTITVSTNHVEFTNDLTINGGTLDFNLLTTYVNNNCILSSGGIIMDGSTDALNIDGNFTVTGGTNTISDGDIFVGGNLDVSNANSFVASSATPVIEMDGATTPVNITV